VTGAVAFDRLAAADVVVRSPGVPQTHPWVVELRRRGATITSGTALWMADHADRTVGVTGSKGKSTTSSLITHLLTAAGRPNTYGGNIGVPVLDLGEAELYVLELSSYQCSDLTDSPRVAVVTALFPEHLDAHGGERAYYRDKLNLLMHRPETIVVNGLDEQLAAELGDRPAVRAGRPDTFHIAPGPDGRPYVFSADQPLFSRASLPLVGRHNAGNLCVALAVLDALGVDCVAQRDVLAAAAADFPGLPHRLAEIADPSGLTFVDDTLATSPYASMHAIDAYEARPLTVIVGGTDRGLDYTPLREHLASRSLTVIGIPDSGPRIVAALQGLPGVRTECTEDLAAAVRRARAVTPSGGVVLLSPAAPSYGRFRNFEHRSEAFVEAIRNSARGGAAPPA
jgi:UDP-N-acetylmuramoyl-L-alanine---L-glutamate ligase